MVKIPWGEVASATSLLILFLTTSENQRMSLLDKRPAGQYNKSKYGATALLPTAQICNWLLPTLSVTEATTTTKTQVSITSTPDTTLPSSADLSPLTHQRPANGYGKSSL